MSATRFDKPDGRPITDDEEKRLDEIMTELKGIGFAVMEKGWTPELALSHKLLLEEFAGIWGITPQDVVDSLAAYLTTVRLKERRN